MNYSYPIDNSPYARRGERNGRARLTSERAREIRERYAEGGVSLRALAREFDLPYTTTRNAAMGVTYCEDEE